MSGFSLIYPVPVALESSSTNNSEYSLIYPVPVAISTQEPPIEGTATTVVTPSADSAGTVLVGAISTSNAQAEVIAEGVVRSLDTISGSTTVVTQPEVISSGEVNTSGSATTTAQPEVIASGVIKVGGSSTVVTQPGVVASGMTKVSGSSTAITQPGVTASGDVDTGGSSIVTVQLEASASGKVKTGNGSSIVVAHPQVSGAGSVKLVGSVQTVIAYPSVFARAAYQVPSNRYVSSVRYRYKFNDVSNRGRDVKYYNKLYRNIKKAHRSNRFLYVPETGQPIPEFYIGQGELLSYAINWSDILEDEKITSSVWKADLDIDRNDYVYQTSVVYVWGNSSRTDLISEITNYIQTDKGNSYSLTFYVMVK